MTPFASWGFFLWLPVPLVPALVVGLLGRGDKFRRWLVTLSSLFMLYIVLRPSVGALAQAVGFVVYSWILVRVYLVCRKGTGKKLRAYSLILFASLLPLALVKLNPYLKLDIWHSTIGFLGISYLTFRIVGTIIDIRDGLIEKVDFLDFVAFVLFFPTLASGPIDRFRRFKADLYKPLPAGEYLRYLSNGMHHIMRGFLYKYILAYLINKYWLAPLNHVFGVWPTLSYMYAYGFYLFFDFAGYSAFAVGVGQIMGIDVPENFKRPFLAENIKDFWGRWHISLSFWFRDYIYMRFVLKSVKEKRFKQKTTASYLGYLLNFGLMGMWHGLHLQYILYGLYHACLMSGYEFVKHRFKLNSPHKGLLWRSVSIIITFNLVMFGFLIFSGRLCSN